MAAKKTTTINPNKLPQFKTPVGEALYPRIFEADTEFKSQGEYSVTLLFDADVIGPLLEGLRKLNQQVFEAYYNEASAKKKKKMSLYEPWEDEEDDNGEPTGRIALKFKRNASFEKDGVTVEMPLKVFDRFNKPMEVCSLWSGSLMLVAFRPRGFLMESTGQAGVRLDLLAVQVKKVVEGGGTAESFGFEAETEDDDEIPFDADPEEGGDDSGSSADF